MHTSRQSPNAAMGSKVKSERAEAHGICNGRDTLVWDRCKRLKPSTAEGCIWQWKRLADKSDAILMNRSQDLVGRGKEGTYV